MTQIAPNPARRSSSFPMVSVILAVRNGEAYVAEAIESVLASDYRPLEIVVVDGQSRDRTAEIVQTYPEVRYCYQTTLGIAAAYNQGIEAAQGDFIAFISHDDQWSAHKLSRQMAYLQAHPEVQFTVCKFGIFWQRAARFPLGFELNS